jgi:transcriptional regulator with XRE-family HTH domain
MDPTADRPLHGRSSPACIPRPGLANARKRAGFNQEAFAEEVGVTKHTISQWETGATGINARRRPIIAAVLGITLAELDRLVHGEPLNPPADAAAAERGAPIAPGHDEVGWIIVADRLPRRPYAAVPAPATRLILDVNRAEGGLSRARRVIGHLAQASRITTGPDR